MSSVVGVSPFEVSDAEAVGEASRAENAACAVKVFAAASMWESCCVADAARGVDDRRFGNAAVAEIAVRLTVSKTVAEKLAEVGTGVRERLPELASAFARGEVDFARVRTAVQETVGLSAETLEALSGPVAEAAAVLSPGPLKTEIGRLLSVADPAAFAERHRDASTQVNVRSTKGIAGLVSVRADTTPEVGSAFMARLRQIAGTVCPKDPRGQAHRLHDAVAALTAGESDLVCGCEREGCAASVARPAPLAGSTLVSVGIDAATLLGLTSEPAFLEGYGVVPAEVARALAEDATWRAVLVEASAMLARQQADGPTSTPPGWEPAAWAAEDWEWEELQRDWAGEWDAPTPSTASTCSSLTSRRVVARGRRRAAGPVMPMSCPPPAPRVPEGIASVIAAVERALAEDPSLAEAGAGHGSGAVTTEALRYRPGAGLAERIRARDGVCRFRNCSMPAARCEIDHVVPFDHDDPRSGGWTVEENLHCLCKFHQDLKTLGYWVPALMDGGVVIWTSSSGLRRVTVPQVRQVFRPAMVVIGGRRTTPTPDQGECPF